MGGAIGGGIIGDTIGGDVINSAFGGAMGAISLGSFCSKRINKWWVESTTWANLANTVTIQGFPNLNA